jgi:hypothetical protein
MHGPLPSRRRSVQLHRLSRLSQWFNVAHVSVTLSSLPWNCQLTPVTCRAENVANDHLWKSTHSSP